MLETKTKIKFKCSLLRLVIAVTEANCGHAKPFCHVVRPWHLGTFDFISVSQLSFEISFDRTLKSRLVAYWLSIDYFDGI